MDLMLSMLAVVASFVLMLLLLALLVMVVFRRRRAKKKPVAAESVSDTAAEAAVHTKDVHFRAKGQRGLGGAVYGDVLCADGVYIPEVGESDFQASFDGRWIRTSVTSGSSHVPKLIDRKSRRSWNLSLREAANLSSIYWRLPRWHEDTQASRPVDDAQAVFSDSAFEEWLGVEVSAQPEDLVPIRDLWVPAGLVPSEEEQPLPEISQSDDSPVQLGMQRQWPTSLRNQAHPLAPLLQPRWRLMFGESPQPWAVDENTELVWRDDGQAFAFYGSAAGDEAHAARTCLVAWSAKHGWRNWYDLMPADQKAWSVSLGLALESMASSVVPAVRWDGDTLLQRVVIDPPTLDRLHDGLHIHSAPAGAQGRAAQTRDGRVRLKEIPSTLFLWRRSLAEPGVWQAYSAPVAGKPLCWTLVKEALEAEGSTAAYELQWGDQKLSGLWELEHVTVQGRTAVLMQHGIVPQTGERNTVQVWDGQRLQTLAAPWPIARLRGVPTLAGGIAEKVELLAITASVASNGFNLTEAAWRWHLQPANSNYLGRAGWEAVYGVRVAGPDSSGVWKLQNPWREVEQPQHPCADGDYVWRLPRSNDALWWLGGLHKDVNEAWSPMSPRGDGISVTRNGAVLCGTGPAACPHPGGEGWAMLEMVARAEHEPHHWRLHWVQPAMHEVHTLSIRAWLPIFRTWDGAGLQWYDSEAPAQMRTAAEGGAVEAKPPKLETVQWSHWIDAKVETLYEGPEGLWLRKEDMRYADNLLARDDWPWKRSTASAEAAAY